MSLIPLVWAMLSCDDRQKQLNYSLAAAALKNTIPGDFNLSTEDEILDVMEQRHNQDTLYKTYQ